MSAGRSNPSKAAADAAVPARLTQETYDRLQAELEDLTTRGRVEIAQAIEAARALGDLSENGDYHAAKDSPGKMESRIRQLQAILKTAEVVDEARRPTATASHHGHDVTLRYEGDDEDDTMDFFVGSIEEKPGDAAGRLPELPARTGPPRPRQPATRSSTRHPGGRCKVEIVAVRPLMRRRPADAWPTRSGTPTSSTGADGEPDLLFIDLHLIHEVTSPQAFDGLRLAGRRVRHPELTVATADHNVPTTDIDKPVADPVSAKQLEVLAANCAEFGIACYPMGHADQGIVHVIGPEQGLTQPGMTIVCGDSHTSTHGAFGALAFGIGTSEVEHVLATQTLPQQRPATMAVNVDGRPARRGHCQRRGPGDHRPHRHRRRDRATSSSTEVRRSAALSMEGRMTVCNMSIEGGAARRDGRARRDDLRLPRGSAPRAQGRRPGTRPSPTGAALPTDDGASFDKEVALDAATSPPT